MVIHEDAELEALRLEAVARGILKPELGTDKTPEESMAEMAQALLDSMNRPVYPSRMERLKATLMPHPEGRTPFSKPKPGARKRRKS